MPLELGQVALELGARQLVEPSHTARGSVGADLVSVPVNRLRAAALDGEFAQPLSGQRLKG